MFNWFKTSNTSSDRIRSLVEENAPVIDVRTPQEFAQGHVKGSINIPLNHLFASINKLKKLDQPLLLVCRSGARAGQAQGLLRESGIDSVNGGSWQDVDDLIRSAKEVH
jgi:rhodanese-related sulfurtransferase